MVVLYFIVGNYFYNIALSPKTSKTFVLGEDSEEVEEQEEKGLEKAQQIVKETKMYSQNYCGCKFSLKDWLMLY